MEKISYLIYFLPYRGIPYIMRKHFSGPREAKKIEIDFILEKDNKLVAIEVKLSNKVSLRDIDILFLKDIADNFADGLFVYAGKEIQQPGKNIIAVPWNIF